MLDSTIVVFQLLQKSSRLSCRESQVDFLHGGASSDASDVATCSWKPPAAAAASPLPCRSTHPPILSSRPIRIVSSGGAVLHLKKYYFCAPPFVHFCKGRLGQVSSGDQQASAGRSRGGFLSYAASPLPLGRRTAHLSGQQVAVAGCQRAGGRVARTIALLLPAGGGGCYNIHIPPRHYTPPTL